MSTPKLSLELLNGPLDGHLITLESETTWSKEGDSPLTFPWDTELGTPQARLFPENGKWWLEHDSNASRNTRNNMDRVTTKVQLEESDLLKASDSWMFVSKIE